MPRYNMPRHLPDPCSKISGCDLISGYGARKSSLVENTEKVKFSFYVHRQPPVNRDGRLLPHLYSL